MKQKEMNKMKGVWNMMNANWKNESIDESNNIIKTYKGQSSTKDKLFWFFFQIAGNHMAYRHLT